MLRVNPRSWISALATVINGAVSAWHRSAPRQLPPELEAFVGALAVTPYRWYVRPDGKLRTRHHGEEFCAITGVVRYLSGRIFSVGDWIRAGESIGLSSAETALIVDAADARSPNALTDVVRRRLLIAAAGGRVRNLRTRDPGARVSTQMRTTPAAPSAGSMRQRLWGTQPPRRGRTVQVAGNGKTLHRTVTSSVWRPDRQLPPSRWMLSSHATFTFPASGTRAIAATMTSSRTKTGAHTAKSWGVEPSCAVLPIAPSRYDELKAQERDPDRRPARARRDERLCEDIRRVGRETREVSGVRTVWKQLRREGQAVARCTVARLMRRLGLAGGGRGRKVTVTTIPETTAHVRRIW